VGAFLYFSFFWGKLKSSTNCFGGVSRLTEKKRRTGKNAIVGSLIFITFIVTVALFARYAKDGIMIEGVRASGVNIKLAGLMGQVGQPFAGRDGIDRVGVCYEIVDKGGKLLTKMARMPRPGDQLLTPNGSNYVVKQVDEYQAVAEPLGKDKRFLEIVADMDELKEIPVASMGWEKRPVAVYHTHSDESYLPSDGRISIPFNGGIFQVGNSIKGGLERNGVKALHDLTPHDPHDANAYIRSRKTAISLIKHTSPVAIFDVHRDGIDDPEFYHKTVAEENFTQIRIVIGRQNPKMQANLEFAKRLMAYANKLHPEIVKEIFMASGNYNQDLMSTALLFEAGTYTNYKSEAQKGINFLAGAVPVVLGLTASESGVDKTVNTKAFLVALGLILLVLLLAAAFIYVNAGPEDIDNYMKLINEKKDYLAKKILQIKAKNKN